MSGSRDRGHEYVHLGSQRFHKEKLSRRRVLARSGVLLTAWRSLSFGIRMQVFGKEYVERNNSLQNLFEELEVRVKENPLASVTIRFIGRVAGSPNQPTFVSCAKMMRHVKNDGWKKHEKDDGWTGRWADDMATRTGHHIPYWAKSETWWNSSRMEVDEGAVDKSTEGTTPSETRFSSSVHLGGFAPWDEDRNCFDCREAYSMYKMMKSPRPWEERMDEHGTRRQWKRRCGTCELKQRQHQDFERFWYEHDLPIATKTEWAWVKGNDADAPAPPASSDNVGEKGWKAFEALKIEWYPSQDQGRLVILNRTYFTEKMVNQDIRRQTRGQSWMRDGEVIKKARMEFKDASSGVCGLVMVSKAIMDGLAKIGTESKGVQTLSKDGSKV